VEGGGRGRGRGFGLGNIFVLLYVCEMIFVVCTITIDYSIIYTPRYRYVYSLLYIVPFFFSNTLIKHVVYSDLLALKSHTIYLFVMSN